MIITLAGLTYGQWRQIEAALVNRINLLRSDAGRWYAGNVELSQAYTDTMKAFEMAAEYRRELECER